MIDDSRCFGDDLLKCKTSHVALLSLAEKL